MAGSTAHSTSAYIADDDEEGSGSSGMWTVLCMTALGVMCVAYSYSTIANVGHGILPWTLMYLGFALLLPLFGVLLSVVCYCPYLVVANCFRVCCPGFVMHDYFGNKTPKEDVLARMDRRDPESSLMFDSLLTDQHQGYSTMSQRTHSTV